MEMIVDYSEKSQVEYYASRCGSVANGFYSKIKCILLPYETKTEWYLPDYELFKDERFVQEVVFSADRLNPKFTTYVIDKIASKFEMYVSENECVSDIKYLQDIWNEIENFITVNFKSFSKVSKVVIQPVKFGTFGKFNISGHENEDQKEITISFRIGHVNHFLTTLCLAFLQLEQNIDQFSDVNNWQDRQKIGEFLGYRSGFANKYDFYQNTSWVDRIDQSGTIQKYIHDSKDYFRNMGFSWKDSFRFDENMIYFEDKELLLQYSSFQILKCLIINKNNIVSFDDIAKCIWKEKWRDKFSLEAIAKQIEKIRKTLISNKISPEKIITVRKQGYILVD